VRTARVEPGPPVRWEHHAPVERLTGPTVLHLPEATLVVPDGWSGGTDPTGTVILTADREST
jgi:N-methylhydantoinase A